MKTPRLAPLLGALLLVAGCGTTSNRTGDGAMMNESRIRLDLSGTSPNNTVLENAMALPELSMLVSAIQAAGLVDGLSGEGPFTVFAPLNDAFDGADVNMDNMDALANRLRYHVADGEYMLGDLNDGMTLVMMGGEEASIGMAGDLNELNIDDADIVYADIESSNGVIHLINVVLNPVEGGTVESD